MSELSRFGLDAASALAPRPPRITRQTFAITWQAEARLCLAANPASTIRGVLGRALRPLVCITGAEACDGCVHQPHCAYGYVWEGTLPPGAPKRLRTPQRPYVIEMPFRERPVEILSGGVLRCRLALFGSARAFAPTIVLALAEAGRRGFGRHRVRARLMRVERRDPGGPSRLFDGGFVAAQPGPPLEIEPVPGPVPRRIRLHLETPLALKARGRLLDHFDPEVFTARLGERLDALSAAHEDVQPIWDFQLVRMLARAAEVVEADLRPYRSTRRSDRLGGAVEMEGLVGRVDLEGVHPDVLALWRCAEQTHVGKNAVFGFGRVRIEET